MGTSTAPPSLKPWFKGWVVPSVPHRWNRGFSNINLSSTLPAKQEHVRLKSGASLTPSGFIFFQCYCLRTFILVMNNSLFLGSFKRGGQFKIIWTVLGAKEAQKHSTCLGYLPHSRASPCGICLLGLSWATEDMELIWWTKDTGIALAVHGMHAGFSFYPGILSFSTARKQADTK